MKKLPFSYIIGIDDQAVSKHQFGQQTVFPQKPRLLGASPLQSGQLVVRSAMMPIDSGVKSYLAARSQNIQKEQFKQKLAFERERFEEQKNQFEEQMDLNNQKLKIDVLKGLGLFGPLSSSGTSQSSNSVNSDGINAFNMAQQNALNASKMQMEKIRSELFNKIASQPDFDIQQLTSDITDSKQQMMEVYGEDHYKTIQQIQRMQYERNLMQKEIEEASKEGRLAKYDMTLYQDKFMRRALETDPESLNDAFSSMYMSIPYAANEIAENMSGKLTYGGVRFGDWAAFVKATPENAEEALYDRLKTNNDVQETLEERYRLGFETGDYGVQKNENGEVEDFLEYKKRTLEAAASAYLKRTYEVDKSKFVGMTDAEILENANKRKHGSPSDFGFGPSDKDFEKAIAEAMNTSISESTSIHQKDPTLVSTMEIIDDMETRLNEINAEIERISQASPDPENDLIIQDLKETQSIKCNNK